MDIDKGSNVKYVTIRHKLNSCFQLLKNHDTIFCCLRQKLSMAFYCFEISCVMFIFIYFYFLNQWLLSFESPVWSVRRDLWNLEYLVTTS